MSNKPDFANLSRREFLKLGGAVLLSTALSGLPTMEVEAKQNGSNILRLEGGVFDKYQQEPISSYREPNLVQFTVTNPNKPLGDLLRKDVLNSESRVSSKATMKVAEIVWIAKIKSSTNPFTQMEDVLTNHIDQETAMFILEDRTTVVSSSSEKGRGATLFETGSLASVDILSENCISLDVDDIDNGNQHFMSYYHWNGNFFEPLTMYRSETDPHSNIVPENGKTSISNTYIHKCINTPNKIPMGHVSISYSNGLPQKKFIYTLDNSHFKMIANGNYDNFAHFIDVNNGDLPLTVSLNDKVAYLWVERLSDDRTSSERRVYLNIVNKGGNILTSLVAKDSSFAYRFINNGNYLFESETDQNTMIKLLNSPSGYDFNPEQVIGMITYTKYSDSKHDVKPWFVMMSEGSARELDIPQEVKDETYVPRSEPSISTKLT